MMQELWSIIRDGAVAYVHFMADHPVIGLGGSLVVGLAMLAYWAKSDEAKRR